MTKSFSSNNANYSTLIIKDFLWASCNSLGFSDERKWLILKCELGLLHRK